MSKTALLKTSGEIVSAFVSHNTISATELPDLVKSVSRVLLDMAGEDYGVELVPPVPVGESYTDDHIICLEDGKKVSLLKRYLKKNFNMSPEDYIAKWNLPEDYPFVSKAYSETRSRIAKKQGLGKS